MTTLEIKISNLTEREANYIRKIAEVFTDPDQYGVKSALLNGQFVPQCRADGQIMLVPVMTSPEKQWLREN
jgi:hypothetical protein